MDPDPDDSDSDFDIDIHAETRPAGHHSTPVAIGDDDEEAIIHHPPGPDGVHRPPIIAGVLPAVTNIRSRGRRFVRTMAVPQQLSVNLQCYPVSMLPGHSRQDIENGGKIILPPSVLQHLTRLNISYPMMFSLTNAKDPTRQTHCGVLEFIAEPGRAYLPPWMMKNLGLSSSGESVQLQSATLPVASFSKFEPQSVEFLDITNPKAMLENSLRSYACLTTGDVIAVMYNGRIYELKVLETRPGPAVTIIECDMDVDFAAPVGYVDPSPSRTSNAVGASMPMETGEFLPFSGAGNRLDGKESAPAERPPETSYRRGIPDYEHVPGNLQFCRNFQYFIDKKKVETEKRERKNRPDFIPFAGQGHSFQ